MLRRTCVPAVIAAALALTVSVSATAGRSANAAARSASSAAQSLLSFTDPTGDASGAPDLTEVEVSGDADSGALRFSVTVPGNVPAAPDGMARIVSVLLDTDNNAATGSGSGSEYMLHSQDDPANPTYSWSIAHWTGGGWVQLPATPTMGFNRAGDVVTWTLNKSDIGGATSFALDASSGTWDAGNNLIGHDRAPDESTWLYDISGPTRTVTTYETPLIGKPVTAPARPHAGKRFTVSFRVTSTTLKPKPLTRGTMAAVLSVAGKAVHHSESFKGGVARLSFVVPKNTRNKRVKVSVRIKATSYQDNGLWVDFPGGQSGILGISHVGLSSARVVSFPVR